MLPLTKASLQEIAKMSDSQIRRELDRDIKDFSEQHKKISLDDFL